MSSQEQESLPATSGAKTHTETTSAPDKGGPPPLQRFDETDHCSPEEDVRCRMPPPFEPGMRLRSWKRKVLAYLGDVSGRKRTRVIWSLLGEEVSEILEMSGLNLSSPDERIWAELDRLFPQPVDPVSAKAAFWARRQKLGESVDEFITALRVLAARAFSRMDVQQRDNLMLEWFMEGVSDENTQKSFAENPPESLDEALVRARRCAAVTDKFAAKSAPVFAVRNDVKPPLPSSQASTSSSRRQDYEHEPWCQWCQCRRGGAQTRGYRSNWGRPTWRGSNRRNWSSQRYGQSSTAAAAANWSGCHCIKEEGEEQKAYQEEAKMKTDVDDSS